MSSSAITTQVAQLKIGNVQNQADTSAVYSLGQWSFKNSTAVTSVTITDAGNVGINAVSPTSRLTIGTGTFTAAAAQTTGMYTNGTNGLVVLTDAMSVNSRTGASFLNIDASGNLLVGTTVANPIVSNVNGTKIFAAQGVVQSNASSNPAYEVGRYTTTGTMVVFYYGGVNVGNISTNGSTITFSGNALSDERWKENIQPIENALEAVLSTEFVSFEYKENKKPSAGVVAQQLQQVAGLGAFVTNGAEEADYKAVDYNAIVGYLGKAIQEQQAQIEALRAEVAALKAP